MVLDSTTMRNLMGEFLNSFPGIDEAMSYMQFMRYTVHVACPVPALSIGLPTRPIWLSTLPIGLSTLPVGLSARLL